MCVTGLAERGLGGDFGKEGLAAAAHAFLPAARRATRCPEPEWSVVGWRSRRVALRCVFQTSPAAAEACVILGIKD
jgi:hypothetical protein